MIYMFCRSHTRLWTLSALCITNIYIIELTDITTQYVLDLFGLETSLDNETPRTVHRTSGTHFSEEELDDVLWLSVHPLAYICNVCKYRLADTFAENLRRRDCVSFTSGRE